MAERARYQLDTVEAMAMTLRLSDEEHEALRRRAEAEGVPMQEIARKAVRAYVGIEDHRDRVYVAAAKVAKVHAEALKRLGE
jgi:hypothetical protein